MVEDKFSKGEIIIYKTAEGPQLDVKLKQETIWLNLLQITTLFNRDKSVISRHIKNIFQSGELKKHSVVAKFATTASDGKTYLVDYYNLDMIISVGYRVNSIRGTQFRIWATKTLKQHLIKGYTINKKRLLKKSQELKQLQKTIAFLQEKSRHKLLIGQAQEILNLLTDYSKSLTLLEQYDKQRLSLIKGKSAKFVLEFKQAQSIINQLKNLLRGKREASELFGQENSAKFESIIKNLYQTFGGKELYSTVEEKAANLLYLIIKDHPFNDGNKRIGSFLFIYFLDKNQYLYKINSERKINDNALVSLALLIAVSQPKEKEIMINIITNLLE
jgi:prophage maintenance system killer protein